LLVSGIVMVSPLIDGRLTFGTTDNPLAAALLIPSLAAAEMERKKTFSPEAIAKAEKYAMSDYLVGLAGASPSGKEADQFYTHIAGLTGIPEKSVEKTRGFVGDVYTKALGETQQGKVASPYDASYLAPDAYPESVNDHNDDPILDGFTRAYGPAFVSYARNDLGFACDMTYNLLSEDVNHQWQWQDRRGGGTRADASVSDDLRDLLSTIPSFRLMILGGYSDAVTPFAASRYVLDHLPPALIKGRAGLFLYRGGHMFYARQDSRRAASRDVRQFFDGNLQLE
jgi:carboxypeptidase C (cathepsin A)